MSTEFIVISTPGTKGDIGPHAFTSIQDFGADPTGADGIAPAIAAVVTRYPTQHISLLCQGQPLGDRATYRIPDDLTIPSNITLVIENAALRPDDGVIVTLAGGFSTSSFEKIFDNCLEGQGTIKFASTSRVEKLWPEFWGAAGGGANDTAPIEAGALAGTTLANQIDIPLYFLPRAYSANVNIEPYYSGDSFVKGRVFIGSGHGTRLLAYDHTKPAISFDARKGSKSVNAMIRLEKMFVGEGSTTTGANTIHLKGSANQGYLCDVTEGDDLVTIRTGFTTDMVEGEVWDAEGIFADGTVIDEVVNYYQVRTSNPALVSSTTFDASRRMSTLDGSSRIVLTVGNTSAMVEGQYANGGNIPANAKVGTIVDLNTFDLADGVECTGTDTDLILYLGGIEVSVGINCRIYGGHTGLYVANNRADSGGGRCMVVERPLGFFGEDYQFEGGIYGYSVFSGSNARIEFGHGRINTCGGFAEFIDTSGCQIVGGRQEEGSLASDQQNLASIYLEDCIDASIKACANEGSGSIQTVIYILGTNPDDPAESGVSTNISLEDLNLAAPSRLDRAGLHMIHLSGNVYGNKIEGRMGGVTSSFQLHGTVQSGNAQITGLEDTTRVRGSYVANVSGLGIPTGARVKTVDSISAITMDVPATDDGAPVTLTFTNSGDDLLVESISKRFTVNVLAGSGTYIIGEPLTTAAGRRGVIESYDALTGVVGLSKSNGTWAVGEVVIGEFSNASRTISGGVTVGAVPHRSDPDMIMYANNAGPVVAVIPQVSTVKYRFRDERGKVLSIKNGRSMNVNNQAFQPLELEPGTVATNAGSTGTVNNQLPAVRIGMGITLMKAADFGWRADPQDNELIAGPTVTRSCTLANGSAVVQCPRGTAGIIQNSRIFGTSASLPPGSATSAAKSGGNTGTGTMGAVAVTSTTAQPGVYQLRITATAPNAGQFTLTAPDSTVVGTGNVASAFATGGLSFTLADGGVDFIVGDGFDITVKIGLSVASIDSPTQFTMTAPATGSPTLNLTIGGGAPGKFVSMTNVGDSLELMAEKQATVMTGSIASTSAVIQNLASTAGLLRGQRATGTGIPSGTNILTVDSTSQVTLTAVASVTKTDAAITFHGVWAIKAIAGEPTFEA